MSELREAALEYARQGWPIFPCRRDKTPYTRHGVLDATTDETKIEEWWARWPGANIALACGDADLLVLDYDPGSSADAVRDAILDLPDTLLTAKTPRGGTHEYYRLQPGDVVPSRAQPFAEHVDVRSHNGYVLLPPSETKDGSYEWLEQGEPAMRTQALVDACGKGREKATDRDQWVIEPDMPEHVELARRYLRGEVPIGNAGKYCRPAIEHQGGNQATYDTAAMMVSFGLSQGTALEVLHEEYNREPEGGRPGCSPPWPYEDLERIVENAYRYYTSAPGNVTAAYHVAKTKELFRPVEKAMGEGSEVQVGRFRVVDWPALRVIAPPRFILPDTLPTDAYAMLVGPTGSYKTFIALDMALTVATGGPSTDWPAAWGRPPFPGPVLFTAGEGRSGLRRRAEAWCERNLGGVPADLPFFLADPVPHVHEQADAYLEAARKKSRHYALVVLDTVSRAMQGANSNADEQATAFTHLTDVLRRELGCTVLALHHTGHGNQDRARGSYAFMGDPDTILVSSVHKDRLARVSMTKQKDWEKWETPRWLSLEGTSETLVPKLTTEPADSRESRDKGKLPLSVYDATVLEILKADPMTEFSDTRLAEALHTGGPHGDEQAAWDVGLTSIRKERLPELRAAGSGYRSRGCYDARKKVWRYSAMAFEPVEG